jgi:putative CocE/NonD family hydrolase
MFHRLSLTLILVWGATELLDASPAAVLQPKYRVRIERNILIPMRDGKRLAADLIRPAAEGRFPVLIEYHPYRKDDASGGHNIHAYMAERGFIGVRLDVRGTGGSEGVNNDEYMPQEQEDGYDAVEWLAQQPWSNGNVGMFGSSYGGFTSVQVAMHRPPHLKAIAPMYATDDRYTDDCHYTPGGNMRMYYDVGTYGGSMVAMNAVPPLPDMVGERWAEMWKQRLEQNEPYLVKWLRHQVDSAYWRAASLRPGYERVQCPVFLIGGWRDGYANAMLRMFENLKAPKRLLMGPWVHTRPHASTPGPRMDWLQEMTRFFAHYLRGEDTGWTRDPALTVYMQEYAKPERTLSITPGEWRNDAAFPPAGASELTYYIGTDRRLIEKAESGSGYEEFDNTPTTGLSNGYWSAGGISFYLPADQREDEAYSLVFTSAPLGQDLRILGWPRVILRASSSAKVATFVAKLADVAPDGSSALIVDGSLNGTRRQSLTDPTPMVPGTLYELSIPMVPTGWVVKAGHRLRLALSGSDFPNLWPTPEKATIRVHRGATQPSRIILPVVPASKLPAPEFLPPPSLQSFGASYGEPSAQNVIVDQIGGTVTVTNRTAGTSTLHDNLGTIFRSGTFNCTASLQNPAQSSITGTHTFVLKYQGDEVEVVAESSIRATEEAFHLTINLNVRKNGRAFFEKQWIVSEPRRLL